jgi:hypothetical protein
MNMFDRSRGFLQPIHFFALSYDCYKLHEKYHLIDVDTHTLPSTAFLIAEQKNFARISLRWHEEGIAIAVAVDQPIEQSFYPEIERGDSIELFFDTRDVKSASFNTKFCHHFFFLPQIIDGINKGEKTHFRTEDSHSLCDPRDLLFQLQTHKKGYSAHIFIPAACLHGYDPLQFNRLGFTYRIHSAKKLIQHFTAVSSDYQIDQQPSLWGSLNLVA